MKYITTIIVLAISFPSFGQFTKGDKALGGSFLVNVRNGPWVNNTQYSRSFEVYPRFGVFLRPDIELGGQLSYSSASYGFIAGVARSDYKNTSTALGAYVQKYFSLGERFMFTLAGGLSYGFGTDEYKDTDTAGNVINEDKSKSNSVTAAIRPSLLFLPSTHWALQFQFGSISYNFEKNKTDNIKESAFNVSYGSVGLGVVYYFRDEE